MKQTDNSSIGKKFATPACIFSPWGFDAAFLCTDRPNLTSPGITPLPDPFEIPY